MADEEQLLRNFRITDVLACVADPTKNRVIAVFLEDVSPVFPYLNAVVHNLIYNPGAGAITLKRGCRLLTIYPRGATLAKVDGAQDAEEQLRWFQRLANETWQQRATITPLTEQRRRVDPLDVYQLLPQLNCGACGQYTCWAFSWELLFGENALADCPHLYSPGHAEGGRRLAELIG